MSFSPGNGHPNPSELHEDGSVRKLSFLNNSLVDVLYSIVESLSGRFWPILLQIEYVKVRKLDTAEGCC